MSDLGTDIDLDLEVPAALDGQRVDRVLSMLTGVSRRSAADAIDRGAVWIEDERARTRSTVLRTGQRLRAALSGSQAPRPSADPDVPLAVVYADDDLIVVDKPAGVVVHHGAGHRGGTLVDGLLARFADLARLPALVDGDPTRPGIVHRLDKGTSGLLVVARSPQAYRLLAEQFRRHRAERRYVALVAGTLEGERGVVDAPVGRSTRRPDRMAVVATGRPARTAYRVLGRFAGPVPATLVEAQLESGRTHQVRVHLASIGHPVVGDERYGVPASRPPALVSMLAPGRVFLHARVLGLVHPDGTARRWESPLPADLEAVLRELLPG